MSFFFPCKIKDVVTSYVKWFLSEKNDSEMSRVIGSVNLIDDNIYIKLMFKITCPSSILPS